MTTQDLMRYDLLVQKALRHVVRIALLHVAKSGLPEEHHFFIAIKTRHPGVVLSPRLRKKYPQDITIVLQHQFWDLVVLDERFEVTLSFDNIPERLVIPFDSVVGFFDPSVQFGLQFDELPFEEEAEDSPPPASSEETPEERPEGAEVVSLDAFRKKN